MPKRSGHPYYADWLRRRACACSSSVQPVRRFKTRCICTASGCSDGINGIPSMEDLPPHVTPHGSRGVSLTTPVDRSGNGNVHYCKKLGSRCAQLLSQGCDCFVVWSLMVVWMLECRGRVTSVVDLSWLTSSRHLRHLCVHMCASFLSVFNLVLHVEDHFCTQAFGSVSFFLVSFIPYLYVVLTVPLGATLVSLLEISNGVLLKITTTSAATSP